MVTVVPLKVWHIKFLQQLGALQFLSQYVTEEKLLEIEGQQHAYTVLDESGTPLICGGVLMYWPGRGEAWSFLNPWCKKEFIGIHNAARRFLISVDCRRIEATVDFDFAAGHRWAKLLGFQLEAERLRSYNIDGRDASLYALIKE